MYASSISPGIRDSIELLDDAKLKIETLKFFKSEKVHKMRFFSPYFIVTLGSASRSAFCSGYNGVASWQLFREIRLTDVRKLLPKK